MKAKHSNTRRTSRNRRCSKKSPSRRALVKSSVCARPRRICRHCWIWWRPDRKSPSPATASRRPNWSRSQKREAWKSFSRHGRLPDETTDSSRRLRMKPSIGPRRARVVMYLDSAIIVKLLVREADSEWFERNLSGQSFESSELCPGGSLCRVVVQRAQAATSRRRNASARRRNFFR